MGVGVDAHDQRNTQSRSFGPLLNLIHGLGTRSTRGKRGDHQEARALIHFVLGSRFDSSVLNTQRSCFVLGDFQTGKSRLPYLLLQSHLREQVFDALFDRQSPIFVGVDFSVLVQVTTPVNDRNNSRTNVDDGFVCGCNWCAGDHAGQPDKEEVSRNH